MSADITKKENYSILEWEVEEGLLESPSVTNRNLFAKKFQNESADSILKKYAFFDAGEIESFYTQVFDLLPEMKLSGVGVELGAGTAGFSSVTCKYFPNIDQIYALEVVPEVVKLLQPKTIYKICGSSSAKIQSVIGSFNNIEFPDNSVDFCIEVESLHHSEDLAQTLVEAARVLKPGGYLLLLDRAHSNSLSEKQRKLMLNVEYSDTWKKENGYEMVKLNRAKNGEHEIRLNEWEKTLFDSGFKIERRLELRLLTFKKLIRSLLLCLPFNFRKLFNILPSRVRPQEGEILWMIRQILHLPDNNSIYRQSLRDYTVFLTTFQGKHPD